MYRDWVLIGLAIILLCLLVYVVYRLVYNKEIIPEGFLTTPPATSYTIPDLSGVLGRYVRIRPSLTGDGYLTISQIQVIDINGTNIALNQPTFATSQGGNPIDQMYGDQELVFNSAMQQGYAERLLNGRGGYTLQYKGQPYTSDSAPPAGTNQYTIVQPGTYVSLGPSSAVDGNIAPRRGLVNIFETSAQNYTTVPASYSTINIMNAANRGSGPPPPDNQYWQVDLGKDQLIQNVIYTGQLSPINNLLIPQSENPFFSIDSLGQITYYRINQVDRINGMRLEILNSANNVIYTNTFKTTNTVQNISIPKIVTASTTLATTQTINLIPDLSGLYQIANAFTLNQTDYESVNNERIAMQTHGELYRISLLPAEQQVTRRNEYRPPASYHTWRTTLMKAAGERYMALPMNPFDGVNFNMFSTLQSSYPLMFFNDIISPYYTREAANRFTRNNTYDNKFRNLPTLTTSILGTASTAAINEFKTSLDYCSDIYLGDAYSIQFFIGLTYNIKPELMVPYIRNDNIKNLCMPSIVSVGTSAGYVQTVSSSNNSWNLSFCTNRQITPTMLSLIPYISRNYIIQWIYGRTQRYMQYTAEKAGQAISTTSVSSLVKLVPASNGVQFTSYQILDSIAQQFYDALGGNYAMTYIYDALPLGSTMVDVRFDLTIHNGSSSSVSAAMSDLKAQYENIVKSKKVSEDLIDQARTSYDTQIPQMEIDSINDTAPPFQGAVARLFYTIDTPTTNPPTITITGFILDKTAVTSFIPELNGGLYPPLGNADGNVNFTPSIIYTKNAIKPLNCSDPETIQRVIFDYKDTVESHPYILKTASQPVDTTNMSIYVNSVLGVAQVSPTQCAYRWVETLYDSSTNVPQPRPIPPGTATSTARTVPCPNNTAASLLTCKKGSSATTAETAANPCLLCTPGPLQTTRNVLVTYIADKTNWFATNTTFDPSGITILPSTSIPQCVFDPFKYQESIFPRLANLDTSDTSKRALTTDFLNSTFNRGTAPICPKSIPGYTFDPQNYIIANPSSSLNSALNDYIKTGIFNGAVVRGATTITPLAAPITLVKPVVAKTNLDNMSGTCPTTSCEDLNVLFSLADQYNTDAMYPGSILRITAATTPNSFQCDIKADINYAAQITDIITQTIITKGTVSYKMEGSKLVGTQKALPINLYGVKQGVTIAMYVSLNQADCSYILQDASGMNSGFSIQSNTPDLHKPMIYSDMLGNSIVSNMGSSLAVLQDDILTTGSHAKQVLTSYRQNTFAAVGQMNNLQGCNPTRTCSSIEAALKAYYTARKPPGAPTLPEGPLKNISTLNPTTCDIRFTSGGQEQGARFTLANDTAICTANPTITSVNLIPASPSWPDVKAGPPVISAFTDFQEPPEQPAYPLREYGFGRDMARNTSSITQTQYTLPLDQELPLPIIPTKEESSYKFFRFRCLATRDPNAAYVSIGSLCFFYNDKRLSLKRGRVSNPLGTWNGNTADFTGGKGWTDDHKSPLIFSFPIPILVSGYSITTSKHDAAGDPVSWKLDASPNGTFWQTIDYREAYSLTLERGTETPVLAFSNL